MTNKQIIQLFCSNSIRESKANNLHIRKERNGYILRNYGTDIAFHNPEKQTFILNVTKYSVTTSKIQSTISQYSPYYQTTIDGCERGFTFKL